MVSKGATCFITFNGAGNRDCHLFDFPLTLGSDPTIATTTITEAHDPFNEEFVDFLTHLFPAKLWSLKNLQPTCLITFNGVHTKSTNSPTFFQQKRYQSHVFQQIVDGRVFKGMHGVSLHSTSIRSEFPRHLPARSLSIDCIFCIRWRKDG